MSCRRCPVRRDLVQLLVDLAQVEEVATAVSSRGPLALAIWNDISDGVKALVDQQDDNHPQQASHDSDAASHKEEHDILHVSKKRRLEPAASSTQEPEGTFDWSVLEADASELVDLAALAIRSVPYHEVTRAIRILHQAASTCRAVTMVLASTDALASGNVNRDDEGGYHSLAQALRILDESLIVTGLPVLADRTHALLSALHAILPPLPSISVVPAPSGPDQFTPFLRTVPRFPPIRSFPDPGAVPWTTFTDMVNTPFVIRSGVAHWPAMSAWTVPNLNQRFGHRLVPVEIGKSYLDAVWSQRLVPMHEFLRECVESCTVGGGEDDKSACGNEGGGNDGVDNEEHHEDDDTAPRGTMYLAQHDLFRQLPALRSDLFIPDQVYMFPSHDDDDDDDAPNVRLHAWFGPAGTVSPLHHDGATRNLYAQVVGYKRFVLFPPEDAARLHPLDGILGNSSPVDVLHGWDVDEDPGLREAKGVECVLGPGDLMYLPPQWWHFVHSLSYSMSVSFWW
ncbi:hypothetical protein AMAG_00937 [Allomyces macrogynus ATCC 38327]|uniref:JmjC domain-containing protein n=1 Tax=Allomyces macrogynus (strain ATCC 38327) TaxID=578462 RepID=A0A0L0RXY7_ALLM3|nr:hypothetical protein AMAG_00937 [Allomyces macrogynus ATCC 38327]|eukprot:KNE55000.1 hypothetical protein AMAG_00937 [Allomyces macrogynus ATCC 38327]